MGRAADTRTEVIELRREDLRRHPVWRETESEDRHVPLPTGTLLPSDQGSLSVRARFTTPNDTELEGYLYTTGSVFSVVIFVGDSPHPLNLNLPKFAKETEAEVLLAMPAIGRSLFPLRYDCDYHFADEPPLKGIFDLP